MTICLRQVRQDAKAPRGKMNRSRNDATAQRGPSSLRRGVAARESPLLLGVLANLAHSLCNVNRTRPDELGG